MGTWNLGLFKVTEVEEFVIQLGLLNGLIPQATPEVIRELGWLQPQYVTDAGEIRADVHSIMVDTGDTKILVDAGRGNGKSYPMQPSWGGLDTPFLESAAGTDPLVFGTHFVEPGAGYIVSDGEGYRLTPAAPATQR